ncbi:hypothetical protein BABINDRAFT_8231 [Babjeviella inositovora NRRL Y-12698]|uniref:Iron permease FTR1 n=1 Tax=Babjeviella inositovora NRRL Y-12698 TaxID=984486 RepID=A0A1E3QQS5_9ASCO|nr:uncharacterized protein BABINDRAFT_8231 [Babjeviella inositovora NRRL Y-12698]ODQ80056.1 hypothetical protein BABINDRAFT_8231 [Babjeviella inositovora NRRL Y-12698]
MLEFEQYFSAQVFFIILRETLESVIIISVLLAFIDQSFQTTADAIKTPTNTNPLIPNKQSETGPLSANTSSSLASKFKTEIILGAIAGLSVCFMIGALIIYLFYRVSVDYWSLTEHYWEGIFSIIAAIIISVMGFGMLRVERWKGKWEHKLRSSVNPQWLFDENQISWAKRHTMFILPFITTLREGLEAVVFVGGVGMSDPLTTLPLSFLLALLLGLSIGVVIYKFGTTVHLKYFLVSSTCLLYLVAAGLFSKGIWQFELQRYINLCNGQDMSEVGSGPGSYDITNSVWHVNCCNGEIDGGWMMFTAIFGWTNSATYGSVSGYIVYWLVIVGVVYRKYSLERTATEGRYQTVSDQPQAEGSSSGVRASLGGSALVSIQEEVQSDARISVDSRTLLLE